MSAWPAADLRTLDRIAELEIAVPHRDGRDGQWTPIWVVVVGDHVLVRTWTLRTTGWYGRARASRRARILVGDRPTHVAVAHVGDEDAAAVDEAYRAKYGAAEGALLVTPESVASTLRLELPD